MATSFFSPLSFVAVFGSGIRDPGSGMGKNQDPGSGINIPDPQHCPGPLQLVHWQSDALTTRPDLIQCLFPGEQRGVPGEQSDPAGVPPESSRGEAER